MIHRDVVRLLKKNIPLSIFTCYILLDSLFLPTSIGFISICILIVYGVVTRKKTFQFREAFVLALVLILAAIIVNNLGDNREFNFVVKKLADWAYVLIVLGLVQLVWHLKSTKDDSLLEK